MHLLLLASQMMLISIDRNVQLFLWLLIGHVFADYVWQSEFMAKGKNHLTPIPDVQWQIVMAAHCLVHAAVVTLITGSYFFGAVEFFCHFWIDYGKSAKKFGFVVDQLQHIYFKGIFVLILAIYS